MDDIKEVWKTIDDNRVIHIWKKDINDDCGEGPDTVDIRPDWYEENGTPICLCGYDMVYDHTEIMEQEGETIEQSIICNECNYEGKPKVIVGDRADLSYGEIMTCPECGTDNVHSDGTDEFIDTSQQQISQLSFNCRWLIEQFDRIHDILEHGKKELIELFKQWRHKNNNKM